MPQSPGGAAPKRFADWITEVGAPTIARQLGVKKQAVYSWRNGDTRPDPDRLAAILQLAGGKLTVADIYPATPVKA